MPHSKKYLESLEFDKVLSLVSECCKTTDGKNFTLNLVPFNKKEEIEFQINLTTEAKLILDNEGINSAPW